MMLMPFLHQFTKTTAEVKKWREREERKQHAGREEGRELFQKKRGDFCFA